MAWQRAGTVSVTHGSTAVTGVGTAFTLCNLGDAIVFDGDATQTQYEITGPQTNNLLTSNTSLVIDPAYAGTTISGGTFKVIPLQPAGAPATLANRVASLIQTINGYLGGVLAGLFGDGSTANPAIAFAAETTTGFRRAAAGVVALVLQGADMLRISATSIGFGMTPSAWGPQVHAIQISPLTSLADSGAGAADLLRNLYYDGTAYRYISANPASRYLQSTGAHSWLTAAAGTVGAVASLSEIMGADATGNVRIGTSVANARLTIQASSGQAHINMLNESGASGGAGISFGLTTKRGGTDCGDLIFSTTLDADGGVLAEKMRLANNGCLLLGTAAPSSIHQIMLPIAEGGIVLNVKTSTIPASTLQIAAVGTGNYGLAATALFIGCNTTNGRAVNRGGSDNGPGADYAEYRQIVPALYGGVPNTAVPAGALLGYDINGLMTNVFADVVGRVLPKSTNPNLVGGDAWGQQDVITAAYGVAAPGDQPAPVADPGADATPDQAAAYAAYQTAEAAYQARLIAFNAALETERVKWDRIALCGMVPVNVAGLTAADVGKYLVPCAAPDGTITATVVAKADLTLAQYIDSFGTIEKIGPDGRPLVNVKNG